jgi:glycosyltransferase involved in cell wall biosynthesis
LAAKTHGEHTNKLNMKKRVLHITPHLGGGVGTVVLNWMKKDNSGILHTIISLDKNNSGEWAAVNEQCENVIIHDNCYAKDNFNVFFRDLVELSDIVLIHWWNHPLTYDVIVNFHWPPCRLLLWNHVNGLFPPYTMPEKLFDFVDFLVFTSPVSYECREVKNISDKNREKLDVIWSTVGIEDFEDLDRIQHITFNVGYIGTVDFGKLNRNFINLCSQVNIPNVRFIVTSVDPQQHIIDEVIEKGIWEKFGFLGHVPRVPHVLRILSEVDVFGYPLQPQHFGTCEQALGEAMMAGCIPVVLANPAEKYIIKHMETGMVADTPEEYPRAIEYLYKNPDLRKQMAENTKTFAKKQYDITKTIQEWNKLFDKAMSTDKNNHIWDLNRTTKYSPAELYVESLGEYALPLRQYIGSKDTGEQTKAINAIKQLFNTNPMFYSQNKGSVLQYLRFFPDDQVLSSWADILHTDNQLKRI